jgi:hypothetical protein
VATIDQKERGRGVELDDGFYARQETTPGRAGWAGRNGKEEIGLWAKSRGPHVIRIKVSFFQNCF